jgi:hypothetical protein
MDVKKSGWISGVLFAAAVPGQLLGLWGIEKRRERQKRRKLQQPKHQHQHHEEPTLPLQHQRQRQPPLQQITSPPSQNWRYLDMLISPLLLMLAGSLLSLGVYFRRFGMMLIGRVGMGVSSGVMMSVGLRM